MARDVIVINEPFHPESIPVGEAGVLDDTIRFETEQARNPNALGVMDRMMRPDHFLNMLAKEAECREDILVTDASSLNLRFKKADSKKASRFVIEPDPNLFPKGSKVREWFKEYGEMVIDPTGYRSACNQIERSAKVFTKFSDPQGRFMSELTDYFRRSSGRGLIVRTTNHGRKEEYRTVDAFAPGNTNTISNFQLMSATMHRINQVYGDCIRGVHTMLGENPENLSYRLLFGNPIYREAGGDHKKMSFLMFNFMGSEHCFSKTEIDLGFWRMICANGAVRHDLSLCHVSWNRFDSENKFLKKVSNLIDMSGVFGDCIARKIQFLESSPLEIEPHDLLTALDERRLIDARVFSTAMLSLNQVLPETNWDFLNLLTDSAKTHGDMRNRTKAESKALMLAMQPKAFNGVVTDGFSKVSASGDLMSDLKKFSFRDN